MLEKPDLDDERILRCLNSEFGLAACSIVFLPLGADLNTAVYKAVCSDGSIYFVKLRSGTFDEATVQVPHTLRVEFGLQQVIPPLARSTGHLWASLDDYAVILYPFVDGENGFERSMSNENWFDLGQVLKLLHSARLSDALLRRLPREDYSSYWRDRVVMFQSLVETTAFSNPEAGEAASLLRANRDVIDGLVSRTNRLAVAVAGRNLEFVPCHADIHAGNVLIDNDGRLHVVDWDTLMLAPKERDLMFVGAGIGGVWNSTEDWELFRQGYGPADVDADALAYYRYERILVDISEFCDQLLLTDEGGDDRQQGLGYLASSFGPDGLIEFTLSLGVD